MRRIHAALLVLLLIAGLVPAATVAATAQVTGTLNTAEPVTLSADAVAVITLVDQQAAPSAGVVIGQQRIDGAKLPAAFSVPYDDTLVDPAHSYALFASVVDGATSYQSVEPIPVITGGPTADVAVTLAPPSAAATGAITGTDRASDEVGADARGRLDRGADQPGQGHARGAPDHPDDHARSPSRSRSPTTRGSSTRRRPTWCARASATPASPGTRPRACRPSQNGTVVPNVAVTVSEVAGPVPSLLPSTEPSAAPSAAPDGQLRRRPRPRPHRSPDRRAHARPHRRAHAHPHRRTDADTDRAPDADTDRAPDADPDGAPDGRPRTPDAHRHTDADPDTDARPSRRRPRPSPVADRVALPDAAARHRDHPRHAHLERGPRAHGQRPRGGPARRRHAGAEPGQDRHLRLDQGSRARSRSSSSSPTRSRSVTKGNPYRLYAGLVDGDNAWVTPIGVSVDVPSPLIEGVELPLAFRPDLLKAAVGGDDRGRRPRPGA